MIFNDLHDNLSLFSKLQQQVKDIPYDIVFFNGDCIADPPTEEAALRSIVYYCRGIGSDSIPSVFILGNHEVRGVYGRQLLLYRLLGKAGGDYPYGAFNIGDTRFVILDFGEDWSDDHPEYIGPPFNKQRKDMAEFMKKEMNSEAFKSAARRVLIHHIPVYGYPLGQYYASYDEWYAEWQSILANATFDICINGHMHSYKYYAKGALGNNFPIVWGGGDNEQNATVIVLRKQGTTMTLTVLNAQGETLLSMNF